jgi:hypothetical protein
MRRTGTSKTCGWHWQKRFMQEGLEGLLRDKTRPSRIPALTLDTVASVVSGRIGSVRNFVCGRPVEHYAAMALMKGSPKMTANWALAMFHSRGGILHSFSDLFKIR